MKRIISFILVVCLILGLLAGISFSVFAAPATIEITGVTAPAVGQALTTDGITGAPEGFALAHAYWEKYDYTEGSFANLDQPDEAAVKGVYRLYMYFDSTGGSFTYDDEDLIAAATVNGETTDEYNLVDNEHEQIVAFSLSKLFIVGNIELIDVVTIEQLPAVQAGVSTDLSNIVLPENAPYEFHGNTTWLRYGEESPVGATLEEGYEYGLWVYLQPKEGYWFHPMARFDVPMEPSFTLVSPTGYVDMDFTYDLRLRIDEVKLTTDAAPAVGQPATAPVVTVENDPGFTLETYWCAEGEDGLQPMEATDIFCYGYYAYFITIIAPENYEMSWDVPIYINNTLYYDIPGAEIWESDVGRVTLFRRFELTPPNGFVDFVALTGAPADIAPGADTVTPTLTVTEGAVTISKTQWVDANYAPFTGKFQDGKLYYLELTLTPAEGYAIPSGYNIEIEKEGNGFWHPWIASKPDGSAVVYLEYSLMPTIDKIEFTVTVPQIGAAPAEPKAPQGAKYVIDSFLWYDIDDGSEVTTFQDGKKYILEINYTMVDGYRIDEEATTLLNGKEPREYGSYSDGGFLAQAFSFKKQISKVEVTLPVPQLGAAADISAIKVPQGANYFVNTNDTHWWAETTPFDGTFLKDKYQLNLYLQAKEGYEFTEDAELYINGQPTQENYWIYQNGDTIEAYHTVSFRDVIKNVELPALPTVNVGDEAVAPQLQAPANAHYSIQASWLTLTGIMAPDLFQGTFADKNFYYLGLELQAEQGYEFSENTVITVDGQTFTGIKSGDGAYLYIYNLYNFGMTVIDTVELTVTEPENGKEAGKPTLPENAGYELMEHYWEQSKTDDRDEADEPQKNTFAYGNYHWLLAILTAKEGYVFAPDLTIKINGKAVEVEQIHGMPVSFGNGALFSHSFGLLEEPVTPPTGDEMPVAALIILAALALTGMAVVIIGKKKLAK